MGDDGGGWVVVMGCDRRESGNFGTGNRGREDRTFFFLRDTRVGKERRAPEKREEDCARRKGANSRRMTDVRGATNRVFSVLGMCEP